MYYCSRGPTFTIVVEAPRFAHQGGSETPRSALQVGLPRTSATCGRHPPCQMTHVIKDKRLKQSQSQSQFIKDKRLHVNTRIKTTIHVHVCTVHVSARRDTARGGREGAQHAGGPGDDNVNSWSADIDGCMRHQNLVRRRDTTAGEEFIGVRISNTEALAQFQNGN
eukprot:COSAG03_NODE_92_length_13295_cov_193.147014_3_plen_166_part_00